MTQMIRHPSLLLNCSPNNRRHYGAGDRPRRDAPKDRSDRVGRRKPVPVPVLRFEVPEGEDSEEAHDPDTTAICCCGDDYRENRGRYEGRDNAQGKLNRELTAEMKLRTTWRVRADPHWAVPEETQILSLHRSFLFR